MASNSVLVVIHIVLKEISSCGRIRDKTVCDLEKRYGVENVREVISIIRGLIWK